MPIKLLKRIKLHSSSGLTCENGKEMVHKFLSTKHILDAYVVPGRDLKSNQPLFNDGFPVLMLMPQSTDEVVLRQQGKIVKLQSAWVCCGVIQDIQWVVPDGLEYILVLRFNPALFYSLFEIDPVIFQSAPICSFRKIVGGQWMTMLEEMYRKETIAEKVAFLNEVFASQKTDDYLPHLLQAAIDYIEEQRGNTTVLDLLKHLGDRVNHKWLHRNFIKYLGVSPKKYISLQRFIYAYGDYDPAESNLSDIALKSGYYDYNHFYKDFKQYLGVAPSKYTWTLN